MSVGLIVMLWLAGAASVVVDALLDPILREEVRADHTLGPEGRRETIFFAAVAVLSLFWPVLLLWIEWRRRAARRRGKS